MYRVTLRDFLVYGVLGPVKLGLTKGELRTILGEPEDISVSWKPLIWKYDSLQLSFDGNFDDSHLFFIGIYFRGSRFTMPASLLLDGWWPEVGTRFRDFSEHIHHQGLSMLEIQELTFDNQLTLKVGVGVNVSFTKERSEMFLDSIQLHVLEYNEVSFEAKPQKKR